MNKMFWGFWVLLLGCAHVQPSGFLKDAPELAKGKHLEKIFIAPDFQPAAMVLKIEKPGIRGVPAQEALPPETAQYVFHRLLEQKLGAVNGIQIAGESETPTHILETAITDLEPGSAFLRWVIGWGMAGSSTVQVEGRLRAADGNEGLIFADRRAGSAAGGYDLSGGDSRAMLEEDLEGIAQALADTLHEAMKS